MATVHTTHALVAAFVVATTSTVSAFPTAHAAAAIAAAAAATATATAASAAASVAATKGRVPDALLRWSCACRGVLERALPSR